MEKDVEQGVVLDVNSLYPWVMYTQKLPFGEPLFFKGKYKEDKIYDLYIQRFTCRFKIKPNKIPTIQIKNTPDYRGNEYLKSSVGINGDELVTLTLTNVDLKLFFEQYDVEEITWWGGWKFKSLDNLFRSYIDKWIAEKNQGTIEKNSGKRQKAKLMLNSLYGKYGSTLERVSKAPYLRRR